MLALIAIATLAPIGLRPQTGGPAWIERFAAFLVMGATFAVGYPARTLRVACLMAIAALGLELGQTLSPDRHARSADAMEKLLGGVAGVVVASGVDRRRNVAPPRGF